MKHSPEEPLKAHELLLLSDFFQCVRTVKRTLLQIWKSPYMFVFKQKEQPDDFAFLILRVLEFFTRKVCIFLKR